jgi:hypothetical protein
MKKLLPILVILVISLSTAPSAFAYGEGGGFPPGYYDNPHPVMKLVCEMVKKQLPFNRFIMVPNCKVVKVMETPAKNKNVQERINDLLSRIVKGGK